MHVCRGRTTRIRRRRRSLDARGLWQELRPLRPLRRRLRNRREVVGRGRGGWAGRGGDEGQRVPVVEAAAKELIHDFSGGVPRQIVSLAIACLVQALADNTSRVNEAVVRQTLNEFTLP